MIPKLQIRTHPCLLLSVSLLLSVGCSSDDSGEISRISPDPMSLSYTGELTIYAEYTPIATREVGCGGDTFSIELDHEIWARPNAAPTIDWFHLCDGTLNADKKIVRCTMAASSHTQFEPNQRYDIQVRGEKGSTYTKPNAFTVGDNVVLDTDTRSDSSDSTVSSETDAGTTDTDTATIIEQETVNASYTVTAPVYNGFLEDIWNATEPLNNETGCLPGQVQGDIFFDVLWNEDGLYFAVAVPDNDYMPSSSYNDDLRDFDGISIYVDVPPLGGTSTDGDNRFTFGSQGYRLQMETSIPLLGWAVQTDAELYTLELGIPWTSLGVVPGSNTEIGFDIVIHDLDTTGSDCYIFWNDNQRNTTATDTYGRLILE